MYKSAMLSNCQRHRYVLERRWGFGRIVVFVMLNPSTADAMTDDATVRRCMAFARLWGFDGIRIVNLCSWRATDPDDMYFYVRNFQTYEEIVRDIAHARQETRRTDVGPVVCAWGNVRPEMRRHAEWMHKVIRERRKTFALKINKDGSPAHPLYLPKNSKLMPFEMTP